MRKNLFLYLALACFLSLIAVFIVDGYLGIYDTLHITYGEYEQIVEPDQWSQRYFEASAGTVWPGKVFFTYELTSRQFSTYVTPIQASVWQQNNKILDLFSAQNSIKPFEQATVTWILDGEQLKENGLNEGQYTVKIERQGVERKVLINYYVQNPSSPVKPIPVPPPPRAG